MEIKAIGKGAIPIAGPEKTGQEKTEGLQFQKLLHQAEMRSGEGIRADAFSSSHESAFLVSSPLLAPSLVNLSTLERSPAIPSEAVMKTEQAVDLLERYQTSLGNPQVSLKKIDGLIQSMSQEIIGLNALAEKLPSSDPLRKIMTEVGIASAVEIEKFNRGDYL